MQRSSSVTSAPSGRRGPRSSHALVLTAAATVIITACGATTRVASPGGKPVRVQETRLGTILRTDRHNTVTVSEYRSVVLTTGRERAPHGMHFEAAELQICAVTSGGVIGPSMATLRTTNQNRVLATAEAPIGPPLKHGRLVRSHCAHGWVGFEVPNTTTGARVVVSDADDDSMRWIIH